MIDIAKICLKHQAAGGRCASCPNCNICEPMLEVEIARTLLKELEYLDQYRFNARIGLFKFMPVVGQEVFFVVSGRDMFSNQYVEFVKQNYNKSMLEIEPTEVREKLIKEFALINSNTRKGERSYNEMYISNPKIQGVFAYSETDTLGETKDFMEKERISFLKKYALENDIPFVLFGN